MTPEAAVKNAVKKLLVKHGVYYFMPVSNGMGRHGIPDIICCHKGQFVAIECKAGRGKTTALQDRELACVTAAGGIAIIVNDQPETMARLEAVLINLGNPNE